ncbi:MULTISPECIES: antitoxin Xre/MbcA/ParS toxin-binding domain-containing protein [Paenibacillus]|uniref:antitoxin Xre/MbcA/ParS toxin-binding domain-containing protein n=1 Tax=Paenibacillus TaxID=44249 RepID=UPI0009FAA720|nr:antitoxin Xre/MbcA/ParS toxin-binding domain-containing protein [Paenibacillus amylolyticus]
MSMKGIYLKEFNQASWDSFSELFEELGQQMDPAWVERARLQGIPADISRVLLCEMGEYAFEWMAKDIPALGDQSPAVYLETEKGAQALRAAIMRMPR